METVLLEGKYAMNWMKTSAPNSKKAVKEGYRQGQQNSKNFKRYKKELINAFIAKLK